MRKYFSLFNKNVKVSNTLTLLDIFFVQSKLLICLYSAVHKRKFLNTLSVDAIINLFTTFSIFLRNLFTTPIPGSFFNKNVKVSNTLTLE